MNPSMRLLFFVWLLGMATSAHSEVAVELKPRAWYQELMAHSPEKLTGKYPHRVIIVKKFKKKELPEFVFFPDVESDKGPFLTVVTKDQVDLFLTSNGITRGAIPTEKMSSKQAREFWYKLLLTPVLADTIILPKNEENTKWDIIRMGLDGKKLKTATKLLPPKGKGADMSRSEFIAWLTGELGYSGVILDLKGDLALVGMYEQQSNTAGNLQALALKNSSKRFILKKTDQKGASMLQSKALDGALGVFEIMLAESGSHIVAGTKIVVQKSQDKKSDETPSSENSQK